MKNEKQNRRPAEGLKNKGGKTMKETKTTKQHHAPYITFKLAMAGKGLTLRDVAAAIEVTEATLSQKINGSSDFYLSEMRKICDTFGFDTSIFFADSVA